MDDFITALVAALPLSQFWSTVASILPFLGIVVVLALGIYFVRRLVKGASHAKVKF